MKKLIFSVVLLLGISSLAHAGRGEIGGGWASITIDATSATIFTGRGQLKAVSLSSGADSSANDWIVAFDTQVIGGIQFTSFVSTDMVIAPMIFYTTSTFGPSNGTVYGNQLNNSWIMPGGDDAYLDIKNGLFILKSAANSGLARKATIFYRKN